MHEFSDICGEEVDLFGSITGSVTISSDDMNFEHVLSKYAMTFIDTQTFTFNMDVPAQTDASAPEQLEQLEQSATSEAIPEEQVKRPEVSEEQVECDEEVKDTSMSTDWRLLRNRGWVRTLRRRASLKEFYEYTNADVLCHDPITSMKQAMFIDKSRGVTKVKRKSLR